MACVSRSGVSPTGDQQCYKCWQSGYCATACQNGVECFACNKSGNFAKDCPGTDAMMRKDKYMRTRKPVAKSADNRRFKGGTASDKDVSPAEEGQ
ncbi:hypothetical protein PI126_g15211 [Phytophthora idaei]|nr:hypothetical protein PI126_g15211 [Phytophthora idaei]